tara:strand:- start:271 stop:462 length:192 start_codon:yes stop_codon:yes gene_type:complete
MSNKKTENKDKKETIKKDVSKKSTNIDQLSKELKECQLAVITLLEEFKFMRVKVDKISNRLGL